MAKCSIIQSGNDYAVKTPYSQAFVNDLKFHIAAESRTFDKECKAWIVRHDFIGMAAVLVEKYFNEKPEIPELVKIEVETKYSFQLDYVGIPKERDGQIGKTALGFSKGQWRIIFDEKVLQEFFNQTAESQAESLFSTLLLSETATDSEIKSGYRRLARQWHPDVNREPEAPEMFKRINEAYLILSDPLKRKKYLAGLYLERSSQQERPRRDYYSDTFIPPLRCGFLTVTGTIQVGRLRVSQILSWQDVCNEQGLTMVTSWNKNLGVGGAIDYQWM